MKKIILTLLFIAMVPCSASASPDISRNEYAVVNYEAYYDIVAAAEEMVASAQTKEQFDKANALLIKVSNPKTVSCGKNFDPNIRFNFGKSKYQLIHEYSDYNVWERID